MDSTNEIRCAALAYARRAARNLTADLENAPKDVQELVVNFMRLDNSATFHQVDEQSNYTPADDFIAEYEARRRPRKDPAEWGDLSGYTGR